MKHLVCQKLVGFTLANKINICISVVADLKACSFTQNEKNFH